MSAIEKNGFVSIAIHTFTGRMGKVELSYGDQHHINIL